MRPYSLNLSWLLLSCLLPGTAAVQAQDAAADAAKEAAEASSAGIERMSVIGTDQQLSRKAGAVSRVSEAQLERREYDDIARILAEVPGVNIRSEDGYGLRPNIGFRGVTPERSKKINIMEDGVLIGPAPYSAPAAYYFPMVSRMTAVEVTKGPGAIKFGPNTVAGTLNLITRQLPFGREGGVDLAVGSDSYNKLHAYYGDSLGDFSYLLEGLHVATDGFKQLDGGGDTGFDKNDLLAKFGWDFASESLQQRLELKLGYADEVSDETYLGLSNSDFAANPHRRYRATHLDKMDWQHQQVQLTYDLQGEGIDATARLYRHEFERSWYKVNQFVSSQGGQVPTLQAILADPDSEQHQSFYAVLSGQSNATIQQILELGDNAREYYSQGIQLDTRSDWQLLGLEHDVEVGMRFHQDQIERKHSVDNFLMTDGQLLTTGEATRATATNSEKTTAWSVYIQDSLSFGDLSLTLGTRGEFINGYFQNRAQGQEQDWQRKQHRIWLPSLSAFYKLGEDSGVFGGIHKGYTPVSPQQDIRVRPEESVNYELGWRFANDSNHAEVIGFFNQFSNLSESCSFSTSASCETEGSLDVSVNAGEVDVYGLEASFKGEFEFSQGLSLPWSFTYTRTDSEFKQAINSDFNLWGQIEPGDEVPYLPDNMFTVSSGLRANNWDVSLSLNYTGKMKEAAGQGVELSGLNTPTQLIVDLSANYEINRHSSLYAKVDNLFDRLEIASRRPFGARPGKPQQLFIGYKYRL